MRSPAPIVPPAVIGIVGGGQLGRMTALAARAAGYRVVVLEPKTPCSAGAVADGHFVAGYDDEEALGRFFAAADAVTFEFENVPRGPLERFADRKPVRPSPAILSFAQNREREKTFLAANGFPVARFRVIASRADLVAAEEEGFPFPAILKTADFGYDGKGQEEVSSSTDLAAAWSRCGERRSILEEKVAFRAEYSVIVARSPGGAIRTYPLGCNVHRDHILDVTFSPAEGEGVDAAEADSLCRGLAESLGLEGVLAVELFLRGDGTWLVNETAPRPHNSGHFSLDGSATSQFANHVRAVCGLPLGSTRSLGFSAMQNLLGETIRAVGGELAPVVLANEGAHLHLYDKGEARVGRKMGHVNFLGDDPARVRAQVAGLRGALGLPPLPPE